MPPEPRPAPTPRAARASRARASSARPARAAAAFACVWIVAAGRAAPAAAQAPQAAPIASAASAEPPAVPDAHPGEVALRLAATGALDASLARQWPADDAHLCAALTLDGGRQDYLLRFGADPAASVLDAAHPGLVLTVSGLDDAPGRLAPRTGSVQVAIGGQTFFGSTQPGAPFRLELSVLDGGEGGRFVARHLADRSGQQVIDLAGAWRCADAPTAVAAGQAPDRPASPPEPLPVPLASAEPPPALPVPDAPDAPAPLAPGLPPGTAFRQLLTELDHGVPPAGAPSAGAPPASAPPASAPPASALAPPDAPPPPAAPHVASVPAAQAAAAPLPRVAVASPEFSSRRVFIHYRAGSRRGSLVADDLARTLDPQFARTEIRPVPATVDGAEIRFSHPEDAAAARALGRRLGRAWRVRGFTKLAAGTAPGSLEVWIPER